MTTRQPEPLITLAETATRLGIPVKTFRSWREHHRGPRGYKLGNRVMFSPAEVEAWLQQQREPEPIARIGARRSA